MSSVKFSEDFITQKDVKCLYRSNGKWSSCPEDSLYPKERCYNCPWIRPSIDQGRDEHCCRNRCYRRKPEGVPYYCRIGPYDTCIKKYADGNKYCGYHMLYQTPAKVYDTLEDCRNSNPYRKFSKDKCLETEGVGWCTDYLSEGVCVRGTPVGPLNQMKYYQCYPNQRTDKNSWTYTNYL